MNTTEVVLLLNVIGGALKKAKWFPDELIPVALMVLGVLATMLLEGFTPGSAKLGILTGAGAVGVNQAVRQFTNGKKPELPQPTPPTP